MNSETKTKTRNDVSVIGIPEAKEIEKAAEEIFEVMLAENFPKLIIDKGPHI